MKCIYYIIYFIYYQYYESASFPFPCKLNNNGHGHYTSFINYIPQVSKMPGSRGKTFGSLLHAAKVLFPICCYKPTQATTMLLNR